MMVVPKEEEIILRYLLVINPAIGLNIDSKSIKFEQHYTNFLKKIKQEQETDRNLRVKKAY